MENIIVTSDVVENAKHQINGNFISLKGETHLTLIFTMDLNDDNYAKSRFNDVVKTNLCDENGQYYFDLISNLTEKGLILDLTEMLSFESYKEALNRIVQKSHEQVKSVFKW